MNTTAAPAEPARPAGPGRPPAAAPAAESAGFSAKDILSLLRRRLWLIILLTFLGSIIGSGLWFYTLRTNPKYTSEGYVECRMPGLDDPLSLEQILPRKEIIELQTQSQALRFRSDTFLTNVLQRAAVQETDWFKSFNSRAERKRDLEKKLTASPRRDTYWVIVRMTTRKRDESQIILNEALDQFNNDRKSEAQIQITSDITALEQERDSLAELITRKNSTLAYQNGLLKAPGMQRGISPFQFEINALASERLRLQNVEIELNSLLEQIQRDAQQGVVSPEVQFEISNDPLVREHQRRIAVFTEERERLLNKFGVEHEQIKAIDAVMAINQRNLEQRQLELTQNYSQAQVGNIARQIQESQKMRASVEEQYQTVSRKQSEEERTLLQIETLESEIEDLNVRLQQYDKSINDFRTVSRGNRIVNTSIIHGEIPLEVSFPRWQVFIPGGFMLGFMLSVGLAFLLEFLDDTVKSPVEATRLYPSPLLGMIPLEEEMEDDMTQLARVVSHQPHALLSESYRQVKTNLLFTAPSEELKTLLVTGCAADVGNSVLASNLAFSLVNEEKRVLLIDANFYRPALGQIFPSEKAGDGLSNYLVGQADLQQIIQASGSKNLDLIYSGPKPPNPADLLKSKRMQTLLQEQRQKYDLIILDGPPALVVSDSRLLAGQVDGTVGVLKAHETPRGVVHRMLREYRSPQIKVLGLVLNAVRPRTGGYFRKAFATYYDYIGSDESAAAQKDERAS